MLNPDLVLDALVATLQSINPLVQALGGTVGGDTHVVVHHDYFGVDLKQSEVVYKLPSGGMLVAYDGTFGGNFDGRTVWKHRFAAFLRLPSQAGSSQPIGYGGLWQIAMTAGPVKAFDGTSSFCIRSIQIYAGLSLMETPSLQRRVDEEGMDFFVGLMVFPELGDVGGFTG